MRRAWARGRWAAPNHLWTVWTVRLEWGLRAPGLGPPPLLEAPRPVRHPRPVPPRASHRRLHGAWTASRTTWRARGDSGRWVETSQPLNSELHWTRLHSTRLTSPRLHSTRLPLNWQVGRQVEGPGRQTRSREQQARDARSLCYDVMHRRDGDGTGSRLSGAWNGGRSVPARLPARRLCNHPASLGSDLAPPAGLVAAPAGPVAAPAAVAVQAQPSVQPGPQSPMGQQSIGRPASRQRGATPQPTHPNVTPKASTLLAPNPSQWL